MFFVLVLLRPTRLQPQPLALDVLAKRGWGKGVIARYVSRKTGAKFDPSSKLGADMRGGGPMGHDDSEVHLKNRNSVALGGSLRSSVLERDRLSVPEFVTSGGWYSVYTEDTAARNVCYNVCCSVCCSVCVALCVLHCVCCTVCVALCVLQCFQPTQHCSECVCCSVCVAVCVLQCVSCSVCVAVCVLQCVQPTQHCSESCSTDDAKTIYMYTYYLPTHLRHTHTCIQTCVYVRACICIHMYMLLHIQTYICAYKHTYIQLYIQSHMHTYIHTYLNACIHAHARSLSLSLTPTHTHIHTHTYTHIHTHTHTNTHTHT